MTAPTAKPKLPAEPDADATTADLCAWLTAALGLTADPVTKAERWGRHLTSPVDLTLASGRRIKFDEGREIGKPQTLAAAVKSYTDGIARPPLYSAADALTVHGVVLRVCGHIEEDENARQADDWMAQFLARAQVITGTLTTPPAYWQALSELRAAHYDPSLLMAGGASEAPILADTITGRAYVRCADVAVFVRRRLGITISGQRLRAEMKRAGYEFVELQQWQPGTERRSDARIRVHAYIVPTTASDEAVPPYPAVPLTPRTRAHPHARREGIQGGTGVQGDTEGYSATAPTTTPARPTAEVSPVATATDEAGT